MYELIQVAKNTFYIDSPSKIGVYRDGSDAWLIDSGNDKDAAKKALNVLASEGLSVKAAILTHYHADHTGGAALLQQRTACRLLISEPTGPAANPELNSALLYGAQPPKPLRSKFFLAQPAVYEDAQKAVLPQGMELTRLDGHAFAMLGIKTPDGVWFIGDSITGQDTLDKYKLTYLYDVRKFLNSLARVSELEGTLFVPAHAEPIADVRPVAEMNEKWAMDTADVLVGLLEVPMVFDDFLKRVFDEFGLIMTFGQRALIGATALVPYIPDG